MTEIEKMCRYLEAKAKTEGGNVEVSYINGGYVMFHKENPSRFIDIDPDEDRGKFRRKIQWLMEE